MGRKNSEMKKEDIKKEVLKYKWEFWTRRSYKVFVSSLFRGASRNYMRKIGVDAEMSAMLYQFGVWYKCEDVMSKLAHQIEDANVDVFKVVKDCEIFYKRERQHLMEIVRNGQSPLDQLREFADILFVTSAYVWLAHGFEHLYLPIFLQEVPKFYKGDVGKYVGDISFPNKKNQHEYFIEALSGNASLNSIKEKFGWIKARDGFSDGFTINELIQERERIRKAPSNGKFERPVIPEELSSLAAIAQEIVYFRTFRTDVLYDLLFLARPILKRVADYYKISWKDLENYDILDLLSGNLIKYPSDFTMVAVGGEMAFFDTPVFEDSVEADISELKGTIAFKGKAKGTVKIVIDASELDKIEIGDILVASTTAPSFIIGMGKASAFVTDEGGITSHTSIVAREMKKPCIIGTKIATKLLKDGDIVEVNADKGIVKIIKKYDDKN